MSYAGLCGPSLREAQDGPMSRKQATVHSQTETLDRETEQNRQSSLELVVTLGFAHRDIDVLVKLHQLSFPDNGNHFVSLNSNHT